MTEKERKPYTCLTDYDNILLTTNVNQIVSAIEY